METKELMSLAQQCPMPNIHQLSADLHRGVEKHTSQAKQRHKSQNLAALSAHDTAGGVAFASMKSAHAAAAAASEALSSHTA